MYFYALVICDYDAGANAAPVTADDVLEPLDILVAQADAALGGHGADGVGIVGAMDAYADPARVEGEEPRTIGPGDNSLAITKIMGPVMSRAHILNTEGNLAGGNSTAGTSIFSWDGYGAAPGGGRSIVTSALLVTGIFRYSYGKAVHHAVLIPFINIQAIANFVDIKQIFGIAKEASCRCISSCCAGKAQY